MTTAIRAIVILLVVFSTVLAVLIVSLGEAYLRALPSPVQDVHDWLVKQGQQVITRGRSVLRGIPTPTAPPTPQPAPRPTLMPGETQIDQVLNSLRGRSTNDEQMSRATVFIVGRRLLAGCIPQ